MYTNIKTKEGKESHIVTQHYEIGTYVMINNDPASQFRSHLQEKDFHIKVRKDAIKNGDTIVNGTIIEYKDKVNINPFNTKDNGQK